MSLYVTGARPVLEPTRLPPPWAPYLWKFRLTLSDGREVDVPDSVLEELRARTAEYDRAGLRGRVFSPRRNLP